MSRTLIYIIIAFALWLYFKYGSFPLGGGQTSGGGAGRKGGGGSSGGGGASRSFSTNPFQSVPRYGSIGGGMM